MGCSNASLFCYNPWPLPDRYVMEWSMTSRMLTCFFVGSFPRNDRIIHPLVFQALRSSRFHPSTDGLDTPLFGSQSRGFVTRRIVLCSLRHKPKQSGPLPYCRVDHGMVHDISNIIIFSESLLISLIFSILFSVFRAFRG